MNIQLTSSITVSQSPTLVVLLATSNQASHWENTRLQNYPLPENWTQADEKRLLPQADHTLLLLGMGDAPRLEDIRKAAHHVLQVTRDFQYQTLMVEGLNTMEGTGVYGAFAEGLHLSNYQFTTYKSTKPTQALQDVLLVGNESKTSELTQAQKIAEATCVARDLINEPVITLTPVELANRMTAYGEKYGFEVEVFHKAKIQSLKMGGLLAVNLGSEDPPTFTIMEYKPENPTNEQPIILVGKGVVFDTGGLSLKPTANSMDFMKADMAGAAAVIGAMCGIAALKLDKHVIGLIPATDNRPGKKAYVPSDVITMFDGSTVEVLNTDAEGRMILADALAYAKQYNPELVIDLATLTGAKVIAIGSQGIGMMSTADEETKSRFKAAGEAVYERLVEFPLWKEYGDLLKSEVADRKNIGGREAGSITAGKFLEHFTDYPWIHLDIAGSAFLHKPDTYRGKQGTGTGVRLLIEFLS
ncbi:MAG: leucyl aminopeptidase [Bacteroidota bacterium]